MPPVGFEPKISAGERPGADHSSRGVLPTVLRRRVGSRNIKNGCSLSLSLSLSLYIYIYIYIYIYDISNLRVNIKENFVVRLQEYDRFRE